MQIIEEEVVGLFLGVHIKEVQLQKKTQKNTTNKISYLKNWLIELKAMFD